MTRLLRISTTVLILSTGICAQSNSAMLTKVLVGADRLAHVVDQAGRDIAIPKETGQEEVSEPKLARDNRTAGWLIHQANCCTSYTIPTRLAIYRNGEKHVISDGLMIFDWCFVAGGQEVALSTGTVHGMTVRSLSLYNTRSGKLVRQWVGKIDAAPPTWAKGLQQ